MFDDALLESRRKRTLNGKRSSLPLALALHAALIGVFVGASAWFVEEAPDPVIALVFPASSAAPPPPIGGGEIHRMSPGSRILHPAPAMVQPVRMPIDPIEIGPEDAEQPQPEFVGGPDGSGQPTGMLNADGPPGVVGAIDRDQILRPGGDVQAPVLLERVEPDYPEAARRARLEGTVFLEAIITAAGAVEDIRLLRPVNPLLDQAAERAVARWRYRPATLNGRPVRVYLTVTVDFRLRS